MKNQQLNHSDCRKFIAVDVAKGICGVTNEKVLIDGKTCSGFLLMKKCKNCENFILGEEKTIGTCTGFSQPDWAYAELIGENCEMYSPKEK